MRRATYTIPSFEEGAARRSSKCHATLNSAQRGRSDRLCSSGLTCRPRLEGRSVQIASAVFVADSRVKWISVDLTNRKSVFREIPLPPGEGAAKRRVRAECRNL